MNFICANDECDEVGIVKLGNGSPGDVLCGNCSSICQPTEAEHTLEEHHADPAN